MQRELVKEWMSYDVITITPDTNLPEAHKLMTENHIRRLPVIENGHLIGIVTSGDVRAAEPSGATSLSVWEINYLLNNLKVEEIMTPNPLIIQDSATVGEAAHLMLKNKVSGLPVVDGANNLIGIITESDIFRMVVRDWFQEMEAEVASA